MQLMSKTHLRNLLNLHNPDIRLFSAIETRFRAKYPKASARDVAGAVNVIYCCTADASGNPNANPLELFVRATIVGMFGGEVLPNGTLNLPPKMADQAFRQQIHDPSKEQTEIVFNLIETLFFRVRGEHAKARRSDLIEQGSGQPTEGADPRQTVRETIALLEATKSAFKSKLVAQAKEKLETLL